jgi:hypothetical protein
MSKILLAAAGAAGYVLGARAGRERYVQIADQAQKLWSNPKVQQTRQQATDAALAKAPLVKDKLQGVTSKVGSSGDESSTPEPTVPPVTPVTPPPVTPVSSVPPVTPPPVTPPRTEPLA